MSCPHDRIAFGPRQIDFGMMRIVREAVCRDCGQHRGAFKLVSPGTGRYVEDENDTHTATLAPTANPEGRH